MSYFEDGIPGLVSVINISPPIPYNTSRRITPEVWCSRYVFGVQIAFREVFGCLAIYKPFIDPFGRGPTPRSPEGTTTLTMGQLTTETK